MKEAKVFGVAFAPLDSVFMPWEGLKTEALRRHLLERPDDAEGWYELGRVFGGLHRPSQALDSLDHALTLRPGWNEALYFRGVVLHQLRQNPDALASFRRALEQGRLKFPPVGYLKLLREMGLYEDALAVAERLIDQFQDSPVAWLELGAAHAGLGNFPMALYAFNQAEARGIDAHRDDFYAAKGDALFRLGQYQEAEDTFDEGLRSSGSGIELLRGKAKTVRALGRAIEADLIEEHARSLVSRSEDPSRQPNTT
jgi:tetratricopeptide (TPR) repeat protein